MNRKAVIFGIKGYQLSRNEKSFFKKTKPWGIILFSRNIKNIHQLKELVDDIKNIHKDKKYPVLIDQEGGKVSRLDKIIDFSIFSQSYFGKLFVKDKKLFINYYKIYINTVCNILNYVGININTVPVLDERRKKGHNDIGNRSFSNNSENLLFNNNWCICSCPIPFIFAYNASLMGEPSLIRFNQQRHNDVHLYFQSMFLHQR